VDAAGAVDGGSYGKERGPAGPGRHGESKDACHSCGSGGLPLIFCTTLPAM
jgi:hypothetical protein